MGGINLFTFELGRLKKSVALTFLADSHLNYWYPRQSRDLFPKETHFHLGMGMTRKEKR